MGDLRFEAFLDDVVAAVVEECKEHQGIRSQSR